MTKMLWRVVAAGAVTAFIASGADVPATASTRTECVPDPPYSACQIFDYSGAVEGFLVPAGVRTLHVMAWGGAGGTAADAPGGGSAFAEADLPVTTGDRFTVAVGGGGAGAQTGGIGGFGGGGAGGAGGNPHWAKTHGAGGGGGASTVASPSSGPVVIAGGGGGAAYSTGAPGGRAVGLGSRDGSTGVDGVGGAGGVGQIPLDNGGSTGGDTSGGAGGDAAHEGNGMGGGGGGGGYGGGGGGASAHWGVASGSGGGGGSFVRPGLDGSTQAGSREQPGNGGHRFAESIGSGQRGLFASGNPGRVVLQWVPAEVVTVQGAGMAAEAGAWFGSSLVARVQSGPDVGEPNVPVTFTIQGATGSQFAVSDDPNVRVSRDGTSVTVTSVNDPGSPAWHGTAETPRLIAGLVPGTFTVRADGEGVGVPAVFELEVVSGVVTQLVIDSGHGQSAAPYTPFDHNLRVVARNSAGSPVQGVPVTFTIQGPTGSAFADGTVMSTGYTDVAGLAGSARVYAGDSGPLTVVARVEGGPSVTFELTVTGNTHLHKNPVTGEPW